MAMLPNDIKKFVQYAVPKISSVGTLGVYKKDKKKWLNLRFASFKKQNIKFKNYQLTDQEIGKIIKDVDLQYSISQSMQNISLEEAVRILSQGNDNIQSFYRRVGISGRLRKEPTVWYGPSTSSGHYEASKNRIYIDARKNKTNEQRMKTLEFEILNAANEEQLNKIKLGKGTALDKAWMHIKLEFQVSKAERDKLIRVNSVKSIDELVDKMGVTQYIPSVYKNTPPVYNKSTIKTVRVKMPELSVLRETDKRNVLFWYLVRNWSDDQIIEEYAYRPHTAGNSESTLEQEIKKYQS
jgi:hypothetical protein